MHTYIVTKQITTNALGQSVVTPDKRSGGYKAGTFTFPGSTGNFSVTGVGFKPKLVEFIWMPTSATATAHGIGHMDEDGNQAAVTGFGGAGGSRVDMATNRCIITTSPTALNREATFVSMDADGFTINVTSTSGTADFSYRAYA